MMSGKNGQNDNGCGKKSKFVQVSLSASFANELRRQAMDSGRSMAEQIQHSAKIARAVELVAPSAAVSQIKGSKNSSDVLDALVSFLVKSDTSSLKSKLKSSKAVRYGSHPTREGVVIRYNINGTKTEGVFDEVTENFVKLKKERQKKPVSVVSPRQ